MSKAFCDKCIKINVCSYVKHCDAEDYKCRTGCAYDPDEFDDGKPSDEVRQFLLKNIIQQTETFLEDQK